MISQSLSIVLIDDDDVARESVTRSLRKHGVAFPVFTAEDGRAGLDLLRGGGPGGRLRGRVIVVLDLNMPRMNGFEFLRELRADEKLRRTVVFVLTTSDSDSDRLRAYQENIAGYMVKSAVGPQFSKLAQLLQAYHVSVQLP